MLGSGSAVSLATRIWDAGLPALKRWRERRRPENRIAVFVQRCDVRIQSADNGEVSFNLILANFTSRDIAVDHVEIDHWRIGANRLSTQSFFLKASGRAKAGEPGQGYFSVTLQLSDIRELVGGIQPATNPKSSPQSYLELYGMLVVVCGVRTHRIPMKVEGATEVRLSIGNAMAT